ncbi:S9 family peptidase [Peristeroidobacter soli]|uniref:S9 family peptidase n=1 Tax=Peristeroidobacter soli TaxID=2497877 RepID=UPI00158BDAB6|nr:prolyl oligopeptidase family serine peptidase [Peristeroidobacter soli]
MFVISLRNRALQVCASMLVAIVAVAQTHAVALPVQAVVSELDVDYFNGIQASPDGRWLAFDTSDTRESLEYEYPSQTFTASGYPMWAGLAVFRAQLMEVATGKVVKLSSEHGASWSGSWSPDGRHFAFYSDRDGKAAVWLWERSTGQVRKLSDATVRMFRNSDRPEWTPDGTRIVFKTLPEGMTLDDISQFNADYRRKFEKPGANTLRVSVHSTEPSAAGAKPANSSAFLDYRYLSDLVSVDLADGRLRRIAKRVYPLRHAISPDGASVAILGAVGLVPNTQFARFALRVYSLRDGAETVLDDGVVPEDPAEFSWSPVGDRIAYVSRGGEGFRDWSAYVVAVNDGSKTAMTLPAGEKLQGVRWGPPLWSRDTAHVYVLDTPQGMEDAKQTSRIWELPADGRPGRALATVGDRRIEDIVMQSSRNTYWSPKGEDTMILRTHAPQSKQQGFYRLEPRSGRTTRIAEYDARIGQRLLASASGGSQVAYFREDAAHPHELYLLDVNSGKSRQLSKFHPQLAAVEMGKTQLIDWRSAKGEGLQGTLLMPPGAHTAQRLPLVVWVYGGSYGSDALNRFGFGWGPVFNMQMLATRGYAVLFPDVPMKGGAPIADVLDAVMPGVNKVIELGIADPERLAVMGQSFGGYNTMSLITHTTRFKAAVMTGAGASNLFESYARFESGEAYNIGYYERGQGGMRATPWEQPLRYLENSPSFFLDRVQTPLLIGRGTDDGIAADSGAVFAMLRRLGKTAELRDYEGEGHVLQRPDNIADFWERRLQWLDRYLGVR